MVRKGKLLSVDTTEYRFIISCFQIIKLSLLSFISTGSAGGMEVVAATVMWNRSIELHGVRYTIVVSDGDSKAYDTVVEEQPYGPDVQIVKEECINHVSKRLGTALRNLTADCSKKS